MFKRPHFAWWLVVGLIVAGGCSRSEGKQAGEATWTGSAKGNDAAVRIVRAGARALAQPDASVDYVAAEMEGVIGARTRSQALMRYDGYRVMLTTADDWVTRITFELTEAKPSMAQLTDAFGKPEEIGRGMLYEHRSEATGSTIRILAEPVSKPATEASLVRKIIVEGAKHR